MSSRLRHVCHYVAAQVANAAIQSGNMKLNPNRTFAARYKNNHDADEANLKRLSTNGRFSHDARAAKNSMGRKGTFAAHAN